MENSHVEGQGLEDAWDDVRVALVALIAAGRAVLEMLPASAQVVESGGEVRR